MGRAAILGQKPLAGTGSGDVTAAQVAKINALPSTTVIAAETAKLATITQAQMDLAALGAKSTTDAMPTVASPAGSTTLACPGMASKTLTTMGGTLVTAAAYISANSSCDAVAGTN